MKLIKFLFVLFGLFLCVLLSACLPKDLNIFKVTDVATGAVIPNGGEFTGKTVYVYTRVNLDDVRERIDRLRFDYKLKVNGVVVASKKLEEGVLVYTVPVGFGKTSFQIEAVGNNQTVSSNIYSVTSRKSPDRIRFETLGKDVWSSFLQNQSLNSKQEINNKKLTSDGFTMDYCEKDVGPAPQKPSDRSLVIALHGGGGPDITPNYNPGYTSTGAKYKFSNCDYYATNYANLFAKANPSTSAKIVFPIAIADASNQWYYSTAMKLLQKIIFNYIVVDGVNANKIYLYGFSAGGDGVFEFASRFPGLFAAAAAISGHPNSVDPISFRNLKLHMGLGWDDNAYGRLDAYKNFNTKLLQLRNGEPTAFESQLIIFPDNGHSEGRDSEIVSAFSFMGKSSRKTNPEKFYYKVPKNALPSNYYWMEFTSQPARGSVMMAERANNVITLKSDLDFNSVRIYIPDDDLTNLENTIKIIWNEKVVHHGLIPRTADAVSRSVEAYRDPDRIYTASILVNR